MLRFGIPLLAAAMLMGCDTISGPSEVSAKRAAFAAQTPYPQNMKATEDSHLTALVSRDGNTIQLLNSSDKASTDANVWVNGTYLTRVDSVPPHGLVTLHRTDFFDSGGNNLSKQSATVTRVEVQSNNQLFQVQGPVFTP